MEIKILEVRDEGTFIPVLCVNVGNSDNVRQEYLMRRVGFQLDGLPNIIMTALTAAGGPATNDPYAWRHDVTMHMAHCHILDWWESLVDGDVIDVQFEAHITSVKKTSEYFTCPL